MISEVRFGPWLPDGVDMKNPGLEVCKNVIPGPNGYSPIPAPVLSGITIPGSIMGTGSAERVDGTPITLCATASDIYVIVNGVSTSSGLSLTLDAEDYVSFEQFNSIILASAKSGATWVLADVEIDTTFAVSTPPPAAAMGRIGDFLVLGDLIDIDLTDAPYRLRWSPYNNPAGTWGTDIATQSGAIDMDAAHGPITAISGGTFGMVFQRSGISRMTYTGGATVFRLELYEKNLGCIAPRSVVRVGDTAFYLSHDSFSQTDGSSSTKISTGKVWEWFSERVTATYLRNVQGAADYKNRCIIWAFPSTESSSLTDQLWYNWETGNWSYVEMQTDGFVEGVKPGLSLEQVALEYPNIDAMPLSLDSPEFRASGRTLSLFQGNNLARLTGKPLEATFGTGDMQPEVGNRVFIRSVTPMIDVSDKAMTVCIGQRESTFRPLFEGGDVTVGSVGFAPFNVDTRYARTSIKIAGGFDWKNAYGYQMDFDVSGRT